MIARGLLAGAALLLAATGTALACQGKSDPALDDNFSKPDPGWPASDNVVVTPQGLVVKPPVNGSTWVVNGNYTMDGADLCVTVAFPATMPTPANEDTVGDVGVVFWKRDNDNYYLAAISPDGIAAISRSVSGQWTTIVDPIKSPAIKTGGRRGQRDRGRDQGQCRRLLRQRRQDHRISAAKPRPMAARPGSMPRAAHRSPPGCSPGYKSIPMRHRGWICARA